MATLNVRNLDDSLVNRLKQRAASNGRSAEAEHREILKQALNTGTEPSWDDLAARSREMTKDRSGPSSEILVREDRDSR